MRRVLNNNSFSITNGFSFAFKEGNTEITAGGSVFTGKEYVYVNDDLVSQKKSYSKNSKHPFAFDNNNYEIQFLVTNILKGRMECSLLKNDKLIKKYKMDSNYKFNIFRLLAYLILGAAYGSVMSYYNWSSWSLILLLPFMYILSMHHIAKNTVITEVKA